MPRQKQEIVGKAICAHTTSAGGQWEGRAGPETVLMVEFYRASHQSEMSVFTPVFLSQEGLLLAHMPFLKCCYHALG